MCNVDVSVCQCAIFQSTRQLSSSLPPVSSSIVSRSLSNSTHYVVEQLKSMLSSFCAMVQLSRSDALIPVLFWFDYNFSCFIHPGPDLYYGLLLPIGLILLHNGVTFILIMRSILKTGMKSGKVKKSTAKDTIARLQNAITISILLGLTWAFGFLALYGATFTFQLLFCLCNSFQGLLIFLLFCLRADDVKKTLKPYFKWVKVPDISRSTVYKVSETEEKFNANDASVSLSTYNITFESDVHDDPAVGVYKKQKMFSLSNSEGSNGNMKQRETQSKIFIVIK